MQLLCQICCNPKRRLRFYTNQLSICQWCVTELSKSETSPEKILRELRNSEIAKLEKIAANELAYLQSLSAPPPQAPIAALEQVSQYADTSVRRDEGIMQSLYRSLIDDTKRRSEVAALSVHRKDNLIAGHRQAVSDHMLYQAEIDAKTRKNEAFTLQIPELAEAEILKFLTEAKVSEPKKSKEVRLIRASTAKLIDFHRNEYERPVQLGYEEQKKRIRMRDSYKCVRCERGFAQGELHVHHVIPLSRRGTNADANLVTLCHPCHNKQHPDIQVTRIFPIKRRSQSLTFVAVDIETTGLSNEDSIIEIAAVRFVDGNVKDVFCSLLRSKRAISAFVTRLTGITPLMIAEAPHPEVVIRDFVQFISNHRLVFHNAVFDMRYIERYLLHYNYKKPDRILDTLPIARKKLPQLPSHRLTALVEHFGLPVSRSHRALDDSRATGLLYLALRDINLPRSKKKSKKTAVRKLPTHSLEKVTA